MLAGLVLRLTKGSPLTSIECDANWTKIRNAFNALEALFGVVLKPNGQLKDSAVGATAVLADGVVTAAKLAADARMPAGVIADFGGTSAPTGWLLCDGSAVSRTTYADLFAAISTNFGIGDGSTTFNVPDCRGRVKVGTGSGAGLTTRLISQTFGAETHTLVIGEIPAHAHGMPVGTDEIRTSISGTGGNDNGSSGGGDYSKDTFESNGGGGAHNNMPPAIVCTAIIKV